MKTFSSLVWGKEGKLDCKRTVMIVSSPGRSQTKLPSILEDWRCTDMLMFDGK